MTKLIIFLIGLSFSTGLNRKSSPELKVNKKDSSGIFRIMTYNIKYDDKNDPVNNWTNRKEKVIGLIKYHQADLLGVQEALHHQIEDIKNGLNDYDYIGVGRDDGETKGEYSGIFYNRKLFEVQESGTFWLSENPERPGKSWDAAFPRICTWGKFKYLPDSEIIYYFNTHFDHIGEVARAESARLILKMIKEKIGGDRVILSGDFNVTPDAEPYKIINAELRDTYNITETPHYGPEATFNGFHFNEIPKNRIDHIFINKGFKVIRHATLSDSENMLYPSDHFPVIAEMKLK